MQRPTAANVVLPKRHIASTYDAKHNPEEKEVQYRQLVSRAVTQRLHSPSLSHVRFEDLHADTFEAWELRERLIARDKAILETEKLGITWDKFVQDVERTSQEVHVLTPTQYEAPSRKAIKPENEKAKEKNRGMMFAQPEEGEKRKEAGDEIEWERRQRTMVEKQQAMVEVMRIFGRARIEG